MTLPTDKLKELLALAQKLLDVPEDRRRWYSLDALESGHTIYRSDFPYIANLDPATVSDLIEELIELRERLANAALAERERLASFTPEPDIEDAHDPYSDGYTEGFADCLVRYRAAIIEADYPELSLVLGSDNLAQLMAEIRAARRSPSQTEGGAE